MKKVNNHKTLTKPTLHEGCINQQNEWEKKPRHIPDFPEQNGRVHLVFINSYNPHLKSECEYCMRVFIPPCINSG